MTSVAFNTSRPSSQPPSVGPSQPRLLGQFLVDEGIVGADDVADALELMRVVNSRIGELAVEAGVLSPQQVETIVQEQRAIDGRFSELAVALGFREDVEPIEEVCAEQARQNLRIGDALVELGAISSTELEKQIARFEDHEKDVDMLEISARARAFLELFPRMSRRMLSSSIRLGASREWDGRAWDAHASASCGGLNVGLSVERSVAAALAVRLTRDGTPSIGTRGASLIADFLGVTAQMVRERLGHGDLGTDIPLLTPDELPIQGRAYDVAFEGGRGVLVIDG